MRFYGERSMMWVREEDVQEGSLDDSHVEEMQIWGRLHKKCVWLPSPFRSASCSLSAIHLPQNLLPDLCVCHDVLGRERG